jgi:hypothetical protein
VRNKFLLKNHGHDFVVVAGQFGHANYKIVKCSRCCLSAEETPGRLTALPDAPADWCAHCLERLMSKVLG